jgi:hypothetical protein
MFNKVGKGFPSERVPDSGSKIPDHLRDVPTGKVSNLGSNFIKKLAISDREKVVVVNLLEQLMIKSPELKAVLGDFEALSQDSRRIYSKVTELETERHGSELGYAVMAAKFHEVSKSCDLKKDPVRAVKISEEIEEREDFMITLPKMTSFTPHLEKSSQKQVVDYSFISAEDDLQAETSEISTKAKEAPKVLVSRQDSMTPTVQEKKISLRELRELVGPLDEGRKKRIAELKSEIKSLIFRAQQSAASLKDPKVKVKAKDTSTIERHKGPVAPHATLDPDVSVSTSGPTVVKDSSRDGMKANDKAGKKIARRAAQARAVVESDAKKAETRVEKERIKLEGDE